MLVWSSPARRLIWAATALVFALIYGLPTAMIALASVAGQWNGVLPTEALTLTHFSERRCRASGRRGTPRQPADRRRR